MNEILFKALVIVEVSKGYIFSLFTQSVSQFFLVDIDPFCSLFFFSLHAVLKIHGSQLKPIIAMFKLRLYKALSLLTPKSFEGMTILSNIM